MTRGLAFPIDVSPSEERLLVSYCGARRFAYNWVVGLVSENLRVRRVERAAGVAEVCLTPAVPWSANTLGVRWNSVKDDVAPWWREVSMHAFRSGIVDAATALKNWSDSRSGKTQGRQGRVSQVQEEGPQRPLRQFRGDQSPAVVAAPRPPPRPAHAPAEHAGPPGPQAAGPAGLAAHHCVDREPVPPGGVGWGDHSEGDHRQARRPLAGVVPRPQPEDPEGPARPPARRARRCRRRRQTPGHHLGASPRPD